MNAMTALYVTFTMALQGAADRLREEEGQTSVEWLGICAIIVAIIGVFVTFKDDIAELMSTLFQGQLTDAAGAS